MSVAEAVIREYPFVTSDVEYPESDGEPMGETGIHVRATLGLYELLRRYFKNRKDIYVAADMFLYYEEDNPKACKAPDVMVIKGVDNTYERRIFKMWEEDAGPCVIFEVTSKSTKNEDMVNKKQLYASLDVREYFLFDPLGEYLEDPFIGFRLVNKKYVPMPKNIDGRMFSRELKTFLFPDGEMLKIIDPETGKPLPSPEELGSMFDTALRKAEEADKKAETERKKAEKADKKAERLAAKLRALGIEPDEL
ncbi:MAG: Uma2 family endonuclease [Desulfobacteraceae bacterium]|nr:Uma2 family endonuclease [Desulfobacteraceae bacterium]